MATFEAISVASLALKGLLEDACPKADFPNARFELFQAGDFNAPPFEEGLSIYLYRVALNITRRNLPPRIAADGKRYRPPLPVDLYYMLTPWAKSAAQQHRLLGKAMRALEDTPILPSGFLNKYSVTETFHPHETLELVFEPLAMQDIYDIWNGFKPNMYPSVAYVARLVTLESSELITEMGLVQTRAFDMAKVTAS